MTTDHRSAAVASRRPSPPRASRSRPARRTAPRSRCRNRTRAASATRIAGGAAAAEDVSTMLVQPGGPRRAADDAGRAGAATSSARRSSSTTTARSRRRSSRSAAPAATPAARAVVPNMYVGIPITDKWSFGLGVNVPFGLKTEYDDDWIGRFQGVKSELKTINVNPALSWEPTDNLAIGVGVNWQQIDATLTQQVNYSAALGAGGGQAAAQAASIPGAGRADAHRLDAGPRVAARTSTATTARGAGTSACCGTFSRADARRRRLPLEDQVRRRRQRRASSNPTLPALPPRAGAGRGAG